MTRRPNMAAAFLSVCHHAKPTASRLSPATMERYGAPDRRRGWCWVKAGSESPAWKNATFVVGFVEKLWRGRSDHGMGALLAKVRFHGLQLRLYRPLRVGQKGGHAGQGLARLGIKDAGASEADRRSCRSQESVQVCDRGSGGCVLFVTRRNRQEGGGVHPPSGSSIASDAKAGA